MPGKVVKKKKAKKFVDLNPKELAERNKSTKLKNVKIPSGGKMINYAKRPKGF